MADADIFDVDLEDFDDRVIMASHQTPVLVVQHGTTSAERILRATLADVPERIRADGIRPPAIIVIGPVAGFETVSRL